MDIGKTEGSPFYDKDMAKVSESFSKYLQKTLDAEMSLFEYQISHNKYEKDYWDNLSGGKMATYHAQQTAANLYGTEIGNRNATIQGGLLGFDYNAKKLTDDINSANRELIADLRKDAENGSDFARNMLIGMGAAPAVLEFGKDLVEIGKNIFDFTHPNKRTTRRKMSNGDIVTTMSRSR